MTVGTFFSGWARLFPRRDRETTRHNEYMVRRFVLEHEQMALEAVGPLVARRWAAAHPGQTRYLLTFFNDAIRAKLLEDNPFAGIDVEQSRRVVRWPCEDEVLAAAGVAAGELGSYGQAFADTIVVAGFVGPRLAELAELEPGDIAADISRARIRSGKGRKAREVLIPEVARPAIRGRLGVVAAGEPLFVSLEGARLNRWNVRRPWRSVCQHVGIEGSWHGLRHFCATWMLDRGASAEDVAWQLHGHPDPSLIVRVYGHPSHVPALERLEAVTA